MLGYTDIADDLEFDGTWRDIYIFNTTAESWQRFVRHAASTAPCRYLIDGVPAPLPSQADHIFDPERSSTPLLSIDLGGMTLNAHFFDEREIELDLDPRELTEERFARLTTFMAALGDLIHRHVFLTPENMPERIIFLYDCAARALRRLPEHAARTPGDEARRSAAVESTHTLIRALLPAVPAVGDDSAATPDLAQPITAWRERVYRPDELWFYAAFAQEERRALRELDSGAATLLDWRQIARIGGFTPEALRESAAGSIARVSALFAPPSRWRRPAL